MRFKGTTGGTPSLKKLTLDERIQKGYVSDQAFGLMPVQSDPLFMMRLHENDSVNARSDLHQHLDKYTTDSEKTHWIRVKNAKANLFNPIYLLCLLN